MVFFFDFLSFVFYSLACALCKLCFIYKIFENVLNALLLFISNTFPLWAENAFCVISIFLNLLMYSTTDCCHFHAFGYNEVEHFFIKFTGHSCLFFRGCLLRNVHLFFQHWYSLGLHFSPSLVQSSCKQLYRFMKCPDGIIGSTSMNEFRFSWKYKPSNILWLW